MVEILLLCKILVGLVEILLHCIRKNFYTGAEKLFHVTGNCYTVPMQQKNCYKEQIKYSVTISL